MDLRAKDSPLAGAGAAGADLQTALLFAPGRVRAGDEDAARAAVRVPAQALPNGHDRR